MKKGEQLYEGKAKKVFATDDPDIVIVDYKDDATAFNGLKKGTIAGKGVINNKMSNMMFRIMEQHGIPTHYVEELSDRETAVKKVQIVPLEVIIRNTAAGSFSKRYGVPEGKKLPVTVFEFSYKVNDVMKEFFAALNIDLIDFKLEFGRFKGQIILADEISPDTCRFWDKTTGEKLDKDRFRRDIGGVEDAYKEVFARLTGGTK